MLAIILVGINLTSCRRIRVKKSRANKNSIIVNRDASNNDKDFGISEFSTSTPDDELKETLKANKNANDEEVLEIPERMFLTQIEDIRLNFDEYEGKTIIVEGMYTHLYSWDGKNTAPVVYRRGPGCCGNDAWGGFLLKYDGEYPEENAWIRVTGTPELIKEGFFHNLYLNVTSIEVKEERGLEFVTQ